MELARFSVGTGDRFGFEGKAQLEAVRKAEEKGIRVAIVWNKSFREHSIVHSEPKDVRKEADETVKALGWKGQYLVDADHVNAKTVGGFLEYSDFFTIDVADRIGTPCDRADLDKFLAAYGKLVGSRNVEGLGKLEISNDHLKTTADKYLSAVKEAANVYGIIKAAKGSSPYVVEVSMDETAVPQKPADLFVILAMIAFYGIPARTVAPRFSGRFNKGVEYVGNPEEFAKEFEADILVVRHAIKEFSLPADLKLSVHSGSDKYAIYPYINRLCRKHGAGVHLKTAGTTWLEECIGLAESGGEATDLIREIYTAAFDRFDELCKPYAEVIDIDRVALPKPAEISSWSPKELAEAIRHDGKSNRYDPNIRQLLHVSYKLAAERKDRFERLVREHAGAVARNVTVNLLERHILPLFG